MGTPSGLNLYRPCVCCHLSVSTSYVYLSFIFLALSIRPDSYNISISSSLNIEERDLINIIHLGKSHPKSLSSHCLVVDSVHCHQLQEGVA